MTDEDYEYQAAIEDLEANQNVDKKLTTWADVIHGHNNTNAEETACGLAIGKAHQVDLGNIVVTCEECLKAIQNPKVWVDLQGYRCDGLGQRYAFDDDKKCGLYLVENDDAQAFFKRLIFKLKYALRNTVVDLTDREHRHITEIINEVEMALVVQ